MSQAKMWIESPRRRLKGNGEFEFCDTGEVELTLELEDGRLYFSGELTYPSGYERFRHLVEDLLTTTGFESRPLKMTAKTMDTIREYLTNRMNSGIEFLQIIREQSSVSHPRSIASHAEQVRSAAAALERLGVFIPSDE